MSRVAYWMGRMEEQRVRERGDRVLVAEIGHLRWICLNVVSNLNEAMVTTGVATNTLSAKSFEDMVDELVLGIVPWLTSDTGGDVGMDAKSITPEISGVLKRVDSRRGAQGRDGNPTEKTQRVDAILRRCRQDWRVGGNP
jgi:hypothetical protein